MLRLLRTLSTFEARSGVALRSVGSAGTYLVQHWQQHVRATALSGSDSSDVVGKMKLFLLFHNLYLLPLHWHCDMYTVVIFIYSSH